MLRLTSPESTMVRLVLAVGSQAGLEAPLQAGYYMIGRHKECQVRPKSRSVSRRHCLLHNDDGVLRLFDLNSTTGTFRNNERLDSGIWHEVGDRDEVRCGKVRFVVALVAAADSSDLHDAQEDRRNSERGKAVHAPSMLRGSAWQDVDVAGFLESEDRADQEKRYENIRSTRTACDQAEFDTDSGSERDTGQLKPAVQDDTGKGSSETRRKVEENRVNQRKLIGREARGKSNLRFSLIRSSHDQNDLWERGKVLALTMLSAAVLTFFCYNVYSFYAGPEAKVLEEID